MSQAPVGKEKTDSKDYEKLNVQHLKQYISTGDKTHLEDILILNELLAYYIAKQYTNSGVELEELKSIALAGAYRGLLGFDFTKKKDAKVSTYLALCMRSEIAKYIKRVHYKPSVPVIYIDSDVKDSNNNSRNMVKHEILIDSKATASVYELEKKKALEYYFTLVFEKLDTKQHYIFKHYYGTNRKKQEELSFILLTSQVSISRDLKKIRGICQSVLKKVKRQELDFLFKEESFAEIVETIQNRFIEQNNICFDSVIKRKSRVKI